MTRSTDTITGITIETDGTLQVTDMRVDDFWTSRRIVDGRGAALDAVRDYRLAAYPIGGNGRPGIACLLAGANHRFDPRQPENGAARAIVTRYGAGTDTPIRGGPSSSPDGRPTRDRSSSWSLASWSRRSTTTCSQPRRRGCSGPPDTHRSPTEKKENTGQLLPARCSPLTLGERTP
ncbi:hypothetical protein [Rhodococcus sp. ZPP]|uniref:hypothetical protein n=1 Tax=Rhodococcus sp. ZPP TaxID=2749906 RepID=UPI001FCD7480|nr:hypothetical protein [Rhodococcus sp. ZPP]